MDIPAALRQLQELRREPTPSAGAAWAVRIEPDDGLPRIVKLCRTAADGAAMIVVDTGRERWLILEEDFDSALHARVS